MSWLETTGAPLRFLAPKDKRNIMLTEEFTNLISTICEQYSYVAHAKQYMGRDKRMYTQEAATADVLTRLVSDHASEYVPFASEVDLIKTTISQKLVETARQKKQKQTNRVVANSKASTYSTGLDSKVVENPLWVPSTAFNEVDAQWCANLVIDRNSVMYRRKASGAYEIIGPVSGRFIEQAATMLANKQTIPNVHAYIKSQLDVLSTFACKAQEFEQEGPSALLAMQLADGTTLKDYLGISDDNIPSNNDNVISLLVYKSLNTKLPASMFSGYIKLLKYYNIFQGTDGKERAVFQGFWSKTKDGAAPTACAYFSNMLEHYKEFLGHIDDRPKAVSVDGSEPAFGVFNKELWASDEEAYGNLTYDNSKLVKTYLEPMDADQKNFICAWFYAMFFCHKAVISVLHQDRGGSLKTTVKQIVRNMIKTYYDADLTFILKLDQLAREQYLYDAKRMLSIADALFVDYDEPPTKGDFWEKVKASTGGSNIDIPIKELYSNPYVVTGSPLFYFGSNKPVYLQDKGAFKRRLACIVTNANDTWKLIAKEEIDKLNNDIETQKREFHLLMKLGKAAYEAIISKYGSLAEAAVRMPSIASQLDAQSPWDEYLEGFYQSLFDDNQEFIRIANNVIDSKLEAYKMKNRTALKIDHLSAVQYFRTAHEDNETKSFKINGKLVRGWILHRINIDCADAEETTYKAIGLDDNGNPLAPSPELVSSNSFIERVQHEDPSNNFLELI